MVGFVAKSRNETTKMEISPMCNFTVVVLTLNVIALLDHLKLFQWAIASPIASSWHSHVCGALSIAAFRCCFSHEEICGDMCNTRNDKRAETSRAQRDSVREWRNIRFRALNLCHSVALHIVCVEPTATSSCPIIKNVLDVTYTVPQVRGIEEE